MTGREVVSKKIKTEAFVGVLDFDLPNGAYSAALTAASGEVFTKKLLIAK
jgi:hypothetical protein